MTGILLVALAGMLVYFNLPTQRIRRMLKTANKHIAEENYDEAILTLRKMLEIDPKNENLYVLLANTYEKSGDIDKEVEFLQEAVNLLPENQKISGVLSNVNPEVTLSKSSGTYTDPVTLSMSSSEGSEIFYKVSGGDNETQYSSPINLDKNGEYTIEYYAVGKSGYEGEHKTATYVINLDESEYNIIERMEETDGATPVDAVDPDKMTVEKDGSEQRKITDEQAEKAFENYMYEYMPHLKEEYYQDATWYWDLVDSDENEIVFKFRSYTAAQFYYYIDRNSGYTYATSLDVAEGTQSLTDISFNIWDYVY